MLLSSIDSPHFPSRAIQVIFVGILFAREKNPHGPSEIREKESLLSFSRISLGLREKLKLLPKNDAKFSYPLRKVFAELFSKSDPPRPQAPATFTTIFL